MNDTSMPRLADTSGNCTAQLPSLEVIVSAPSHDSDEAQSLIDNQIGGLYSTLPEIKVQDAHPRLRDMICDTLASVREPNGPPLEPYHGNIRSQDNAEFNSGAREGDGKHRRLPLQPSSRRHAAHGRRSYTACEGELSERS
jgi:hypothetical protein